MMLIKNLIHSRGLLSPLLVTKLEIDIIVAPSETVVSSQARPGWWHNNLSDLHCDQEAASEVRESDKISNMTWLYLISALSIILYKVSALTSSSD